MKALLRSLVMIAFAVSVQTGFANDQLDYERRVGARLTMLHASLDRDGDAAVSRDEARGDVNFRPLFDDMDIDRNGYVTREELRGYLELRYGRHAVDAGTKPLQ